MAGILRLENLRVICIYHIKYISIGEIFLKFSEMNTMIIYYPTRYHQLCLYLTNVFHEKEKEKEREREKREREKKSVCEITFVTLPAIYSTCQRIILSH